MANKRYAAFKADWSRLMESKRNRVFSYTRHDASANTRTPVRSSPLSRRAWISSNACAQENDCVAWSKSGS